MDYSCCWFKEQITPPECPSLREGDEELLFNRKKRFLRRCLECPRFLEDLRCCQSQPEELSELFPSVFEELLALRVQVQALQSQIENRNREIKSLHEVSTVLQTSVDMDEVIATALTAVTAGKGFGLNRAILLLVDKDRQALKGYFAVGPRRREDAARIWKEIEETDFSLREMAQSFFEEKMPAEREKFQDLLAVLSVPLHLDEHLFIRTLNEQRSHHIQNLYLEPDIYRSQVEALGVRELILVPLVSKNRRIGLLMADNIVSDRPISSEDLSSLETFALPVSFAIERATLYERLQEELVKLTEANRRLREQQELILRMEKMALVGNITSNIAHSIRNPLTIIGGFARTLIKQTAPGDSKRQYIESMVREARRLEEVLQEVLNYSESLHPTLDLWDINQLIASVYAALREDLEMSGVTCHLDFEPHLPQVRVDYKTISYCLRSIINNAMEAMPRGGELKIRTARSECTLLITLADSGTAMKAETIRAISVPFEASPEKGAGGLGLSLCARILQGQGADFDIRSTEGQGTIFTIKLHIPMEEQHGTTAGGGR
jgi:signal transduction histidine kinase